MKFFVNVRTLTRRRMTTHRSWFPFILIGLTLALVAVISVLYRPYTLQEQRSAEVVHVAPPTPAAYEAAVSTIVTTYFASSSSDASKTAYDALIAMRVPSVDYQDVHIALVIAFGQLVAGEDEAGNARLFDVMKAYPWIMLPSPSM